MQLPVVVPRNFNLWRTVYSHERELVNVPKP